MSFSELGLSEPILRAVTAAGYSVPTPIQAAAIPHMLAGRDVLGCAQTGTGKTAAFALPVLHRLTQAGNPTGRGRRIRVLVLSPTRELASQIGDSFREYGKNTPLRHTTVFGGVNQNSQTRALQHGVDILIATPGRLLDLMNQGFIDLSSVEIFVLDEADRMLDMGFLPDVRRIVAKVPAARQTVFFSATMPEPIAALASSILRQPARVEIAPVKTTADLIEHSVCFVPQTQKPGLLAELLTSRGCFRSIVFTRTKHGADRVVRQLHRAGIAAEAIHGNKSQNARQRTLANFKSNRTHVLVATDLAARGIDVDGVSHVFNFDLPHEPETYVHRTGRTGRAGVAGVAIAFCDSEERKHLKAIERLIGKPIRVERTVVPTAASKLADEPVRNEASADKPRSDRDRTRRSPSANRPNATASSRPAGTSAGRPKRGRRPRPAGAATGGQSAAPAAAASPAAKRKRHRQAV